MIKLVILALLACGLFRWAVGRWPWHYLKSPPSQVQEARRLLGVSAAAGPAEIREAHRRKAALVHPDRGGDGAELAQLNAARDLLLKRLPTEGYPPQ